jgi:deoxyadenosine/deoxycytidine kinase
MSCLRTKRTSKRIVIDGNIGSGKTTQLKLLSGTLKVQCEPIHEWPLKLFYEDKTRWSFLLQMSILKSFLLEREEENEEDASIVVWERSPESSREVFWKMLSNDGTTVIEEEDVYLYFYERYAWTPDLHVYIRTSPEECFRRISNRHQVGDVKIDFEYVKKVHEYYEQYIGEKQNVLIIDGNKSSEEIHSEIVRCIPSDVQA